MPTTSPRISLVVTRGPDEGTRLDLDAEHRVIGRARDTDLVLADPAVSRRHLCVHASGDGAFVRALPQTAPFVLDQELLREAVVPVGAAIAVGSSVLCVVQTAPLERPSSVERTEARTLLQGAAIEVRGLAAISALIAWLDEASDREAVRAALVRWGALHADAGSASLHFEDVADDAEACAEHLQAPDDVVIRNVDAGTAVTVPAHSKSRAWITFRFERSASAIGESQRRLLVIAGRICASSLGHIHVLGVTEARFREVRRAAVGSATGFLGSSKEAIKVAEMVPRVAASNVPVLICGETGVGKSFVARLIHEASPRSREPLRVLNCASIPESLLESELFGHEKGSFTGATMSREGAFESVGRGTLFLDEIGELPLSSQAKLLRAIEERKFERLGSNRTIELRARVICATNRDLANMAEAGGFRSDLLFRIAVVTLHVPALRERREDLPLLAQQLLADLAAAAPRRIDGFTDHAIEAIRSYSWPGNVRELRNAIEYAIVMGTEPLIGVSDLPDGIARAVRPVATADDPMRIDLPVSLERLERLAIDAALKATSGNRTKAAALLGINRATLYNKLRSESQGS